VQVVNYRVSAIAPTAKPRLRELKANGAGGAALKGRRPVYFREAGGFVDCPIYDRDRLGPDDSFSGPAIVEEWTSTTVVPLGWRLSVDGWGNLILRVEEANQ
jgi:N-methylhydantoinase A